MKQQNLFLWDKVIRQVNRSITERDSVLDDACACDACDATGKAYNKACVWCNGTGRIVVGATNK